MRPEQFGSFLTAIFDEWVRRDVGNVYVQTFEAAARNWMGLASSGMCVFDETCGAGLALEHNGDLYACDHFVTSEHRLGNIRESHLGELLDSPVQRAFGMAKEKTLPHYCQFCEVRLICNGGCTIENCLVFNCRLMLLCAAVFFNAFVVPKQKICEYLIDYIN